LKELERRLNEDHYNNDFSRKLIEHGYLFDDIYNACGNTFSRKIGSYLFNGKNYEYYIGMYDKQKLIFDKVKEFSNVLEIGTYMGHSLMLMLISNPRLRITCVDIDPTFSKPSTSFLQEKFSKSKINFICGNSVEVLPTITEKFDFFHIDGKHNNKMITQEFNLCKNLSSTNEMNILFDDSETCQPLLTHIRENFEVIEEFTPNCDWQNTFMKIRI
jgi:hypothetical protein